MSDFDHERVERLSTQILQAVHDNYLEGPIGRIRVYEALNALAYAAAWTIHGCGDHAQPLEFFSQALNICLQDAKKTQIPKS